MWYLYIIYEALIHYQILTGVQLRPRVERDGITLWLWGRPFIDNDGANAKHMLLGVVDRFGIYALYTLIYALYTLISSQWISLAYIITLTSKWPRWRLNHQPRGCLLNRLFRRRWKKTSKLRATGLCVGNSPGPVNSPHKGPVTRKVFPFDDVIMCLAHTKQMWSKVITGLLCGQLTYR